MPADSGAATSAAGEEDGAEAMLSRTQQALAGLAGHWRQAQDERSPPEDGGFASAIARLAEDPAEFSQAGHEWSREAGLAHTLPAKALQCKPVAESVGRDGLHASSAGGPVMTTHRGLIVAPAPPCGFGVFATAALARGQNLGEYTGEVRRYDVWCEEIKARKVAERGSDRSSPFIREELYAAWAGAGPNGAGVVIDAFAAGNTIRFINCSCSPNCTFKSFGTGAEKHNRLKVVTLRDIAPWEQLSVDYGWYFDDATREDVRSQATEAYNEDLLALAALAEASASGGPGAEALLSEKSEAVRVLAEAVREARGPPLPLRSAPRSFLRRFVDAEDLALFLERGGRFERAPSFQEIPDAVWPLYEVVGGGRVGIPCRCGLDRTLNAKGRCSGIIGRPLQAVCTGREDVPAMA